MKLVKILILALVLVYVALSMITFNPDPIDDRNFKIGLGAIITFIVAVVLIINWIYKRFKKPELK